MKKFVQITNKESIYFPQRFVDGSSDRHGRLKVKENTSTAESLKEENCGEEKLKLPKLKATPET